MPSFSWLHLTDLHMGMAEQIPLLPAIKDRFFQDLKSLHAQCGPWDLVIFTGDLTQRGTKEEFQRLDEFLTRLWDTLHELGSNTPKLLAVPGNHDLVRPDPKAPEVKALNFWMQDPDIESELWNPGSDYRQTISDVFNNYVEWWNSTPFKPTIRDGALPGDFSAEIEKDGTTLGIVGLNTAFLQLGAGDYKGKLNLSARQFQSACGGDGPKWVREHNACLLLTHHPPDWLAPKCQNELRAEISGYGFFAAHLFGHMHEARYISLSDGGSARLRTCQGSSLFGMEYFGEDQQEKRRHGYSAATIELFGGQGRLVQWPRCASKPGGQWNFAADSTEFALDQEHTRAEEFQLLKEVSEPASPSRQNERLPDAGASAPFAKRWAVLVGINDYEQFTPLRFCRQDVIELATQFRETLGFHKVIELHEEAALKPERERILTTLADIRDSGDVGADDLFVFYFSGHGITEGGKDYLLPIGARPRDIRTLGIRIDDLADSLKAIDCRNTVLFIDACRNAVEGSKDVQSVGEESGHVFAKAGLTAFFSCAPKDRSYEIEELGHGSFTYGILEAIREGDATTVSELVEYLKENVPQINKSHNKPSQQPYVMLPIDRDKAGDIPILFNPRAARREGHKYDALIRGLVNLHSDERINKDELEKCIEFLSQIHAKRQLDQNERIKLSAIECLCGGRWNVEYYRLVWENVDSRRTRLPGVGPQIRRTLPPLKERR